MKLRDYQADACDAAFESLKSGRGNPLIDLPTGAGKSLVLAELARRAVTDYAGRVVILAHRKELLSQNAAKLSALCSIRAGMYSAGLKSRDIEQEIIVGGIQSIYSKAAELGRRHLVIIDEAHLTPKSDDGMYRTFLADLAKYNPRLKVIGLTATPYRLDSGRLWGKDELFSHVCYRGDIRAMIDQGYLCKLVNKNSTTNYDTSGLHIRGGEFVRREVEDLFANQSLAVKACEELVAKAEGRKSVLVFCSGVEHAANVQEILAKLTGERVDCVTGETPPLERAATLDQFSQGAFRFCVNVDVLTTGFDSPRIDCVAIMRATQSAGLFCLDEQTEILTSNGWSKNLSVGDLHYGFDLNSGELKLVECQAFMRRGMITGEEFVEYSGVNTDFRVTENHNLVLTGRRSLEGWKLEQASKALGRKSGFNVPKSGIFDFHGVPLSDDELRFIGWVMTDGSINRSNGGISITQSQNKEECIEIERVLKSCGFKYNSFLRSMPPEHSGGFQESCPRIVWTVSKGSPRGTGKHLRGWGDLEPWMSKDFSEKLNDCTVKQFEVLLEAIHLGDGAKQNNQIWTRRSYHISTGNDTFATRLQIACILRGFRCSLQISSNGADREIIILHIKKQLFSNIAQKGDGRACLVKSPAKAGETVWCVQNELGTLVTRRNGKVTILGNCQMVGRGLRVHESKSDALIVDFGNNLKRHGPIDAIDFGSSKPKGDGATGEAPKKTCFGCGEVVAASARECECGFTFAFTSKPHETTADEESQILSEPVTFKVKSWSFVRHYKKGSSDAPNTLRVTYFGEGDLDPTIDEWVCLNHDGFALRKALKWWQDHSDENIEDVAEALETDFVGAAIDIEQRGYCRRPAELTAVQDGRWWRIIGRVAGELEAKEVLEVPF